MIKTFYIKIILLINLLASLDAFSSSAIDWSAEVARSKINRIKTAIDGNPFERFDFSELGGIEEIKNFLKLGETFIDWREMPLVQGETNIFSLLGRAYVEGFLLNDRGEADYDKAARYLIWGRLLELQALASTGEAIAYTFTGEYSMDHSLTIYSPDEAITLAITVLKGLLEAEAAATTAP
jgi:hypothetical protein